MKSPISHSKLARALFGATATALVVGASALVPSASVGAATGGPTVVYDAIGSTQAPSYPSLGFEATSTSAVGDYVQLGTGSRLLDSVSVMMVSWACEIGGAYTSDCQSTPGHTFSHPLTVTLYAAGGTDAAPTVGAKLAESTQTFAIPYRPSATPGLCAGAGQWHNTSTGSCQRGFAHKVNFDQFDPMLLPSKLIWTISYNTEHYGNAPSPQPTGSGPYNSLNVALSPLAAAPVNGLDIDEQGYFLASSWQGAYCTGAANPDSELRYDSCGDGALYRPMASISTAAPVSAAPVSSAVYGSAIGGENNTSAEWSKDHFEPKVPGTESVVTDAVAVNGTHAPAPAANGSLKLVTLGNPTGALQQQARVVHHYTPATAPTLNEVLWSRPQYSVYVDSTSSNPNTGKPGAGGLQFGIQCGSWLASVLISPGDSNYLDIDDDAAAFDTWQTFRYPNPEDPASKVFVAKDGGAAPAGMPATFGEVSLTDLVNICGNAKLTDARVSQGRNAYPSVVSYFDNVEFLEHSYDFVTAVAPSITSGAPGSGQVGQAYSFQLTAAGTPAPSITVTGSLPPGITKNAAGLLSGTPTQAGHFEFEVRATNGANPDDVEMLSIDVAAAPVDQPSLPDYQPVGPSRVFDTRPGQSPDAVRVVPKQQVGGSNVLEVEFTDLGDLVPASGVGAVSLNVTVDGPAEPGFVTVYPCGDRTLVSSVNFGAGQTVANAVITPLSGSGSICFYSSQSTDLVVDINGWFPAGRAFTAVGPTRVLDTRPGESPEALLDIPQSPIGNDKVLEAKVVGLAGTTPETGVGAVSLNVTVDEAAADGFLTVYPCGDDRPFVSNVNFLAGQTVANAVVTPVSEYGTVCFYSTADVDLVVDVNGWMKSASGFHAVSPERLLDTRADQSPDALLSVDKARIGGEHELRVDVVGLDGVVPANGVSAVSLNVTTANPADAGFLTVYPCGAERPFVSSLNFAAGSVVPNAVIAPVSVDGEVCFFSSQMSDLVVDINGWFAA